MSTNWSEIFIGALYLNWTQEGMRDEGALLSCSSSLESYQQNEIYSLRLSLLSTLTDSANARQRRISLLLTVGHVIGALTAASFYIT